MAAALVVIAGCGVSPAQGVHTPTPTPAPTTAPPASPTQAARLQPTVRVTPAAPAQRREHSEALSRVPGPGQREIVEAILRRFGANGPAALRRARCESGLNPRATGRRGERGLLQIAPVHWRKGGIVPALGYTADQLYEVEPNLHVAFVLSKGGSDWSAWTCR